jgi:Spy/CpxP family protein refolding chaperone
MKLSHVLTGIALTLALAGNGMLSAQAPATDSQKPQTEAPKGKCPMGGEMQKGKCPMQGMQQGKHEQIPILTDEQKAKMKELRLALHKETLPLKNQLNELKAKQQTLATADKADMKAINANIDEITKVQNQLMKAKSANLQQIRALLTDEQKMIFDTHKKMGGKGHKEGKMKGHNGKKMHCQAPQGPAAGPAQQGPQPQK